MRNTLWALLPALLLGAAGFAQSPQEWADKLFAPDGTTHNFGNVPRGAVLHHRFAMTNIYAVPLEITGTRVSCGCVTATPSFTKLAPKETGYLDVTMDGRRFTGAKTVNVYLTVGPQYTSTATLTVSANSRTDIVFNPGQVNFGVVPAGQTPTQTIDVEYAGLLDWRIQDVAEPQAPLDVKFKELYRRPGQVGYQLQVTLKAGAPPGPFRHEVNLRTNDPASALVPVLVEGNVQGALSAFPAVVPFKSAKVGQEIQQRVLINGNGDKLFRVTQVDGQADGLTVDLPSGAAKVQVLTVKWRPTGPGDLKRELHVRTDLDGGATTTITVEGNATP